MNVKPFILFLFILLLPVYNASGELIHYYNCDGSTSDAVLIDENGTVDMYVYNGLKEHKIMNNSLFLFSDKNSYVKSSSVLDMNENFTLTMWFNITYLTSDTYNSFLIGQWDASGVAATNWEIQITPAHTLKLYVRDDSDNLYSAESTNTITIGEWYYIVVVYNDYTSTTTVYINDNIWITLSGAPVRNTDNYLYISYWETNYDYVFSPEMYIDELKIYNHTFTQDEVTLTYEEYKSSFNIIVIETNKHITLDILNIEDFIVIAIIMSAIGGLLNFSDKD